MKKQVANCESCVFYVYDDFLDCYFCEVNLDEDEMARFMTSGYMDCPYYRLENEYKTVNKQI